MLQELNIHALWTAAQAAKGAACVDADFIHRHRVAPGGGWLTLARDDGSQNVSDLGKFGDATDWINSLSGGLSPGVEATPDELAWWFWAFEGGEAVTAVPGPPAKQRHTLTPIPGVGKFIGARGRVGASQITREQHNDVVLSQLVLEGSTANKALKLTPTALALDPSVVKLDDPTQVLPAKRPFLFTDAIGTFMIDGVVFRGHSQFTLTLNLDLQPVYGDDVLIYNLAVGNAGITIGCTIHLDAEGIPQWNRLVYGSAAPAADARPLKRLPALGSYGFLAEALDPTTGDPNGDQANLALPGVKWNVPDRPAPNPDGGTAELALTGTMRAVEGQPEYSLAVDCDAAAFTK